MKFSKEFLQDEGGETIECVITGKSRWALQYRRVFKHNERFYETHYSVGATESQEETPYEYDPSDIECAEVFPTQKTVTVYVLRPPVTPSSAMGNGG